jgi:hypothetical protein
MPAGERLIRERRLWRSAVFGGKRFWRPLLRTPERLLAVRGAGDPSSRKRAERVIRYLRSVSAQRHISCREFHAASARGTTPIGTRAPDYPSLSVVVVAAEIHVAAAIVGFLHAAVVVALA